MTEESNQDSRWRERISALALLWRYRLERVTGGPDEAVDGLRGYLVRCGRNDTRAPSRAALNRWINVKQPKTERAKPAVVDFVRRAILAYWSRLGVDGRREPLAAMLERALVGVFDDDQAAVKELLHHCPEIGRRIAATPDMSVRLEALKDMVRRVHGSEPFVGEMQGLDGAVARIAVTRWAAGILHVCGTRVEESPVLVTGHLARHLRRHYRDKVAPAGLGLPIHASPDGREVTLQAGSLALDESASPKGEVVARDLRGAEVYRYRNRGTPPWDKCAGE